MPRRAVPLLAWLPVGVALSAIAVDREALDDATTIGSASPWLSRLDLAVILMVCAAATLLVVAGRRTGLALGAVAVGAVLTSARGWAGGPDVVSAAGRYGIAIQASALAAIIAAATKHRGLRRAAPAPVGLAVVAILFYDPFLDAGCRADCDRNPLLVFRAAEASTTLERAVAVAVIAVAVYAAVAAWCTRRGLWQTLAAIALAAEAAVGLVEPIEGTAPVARQMVLGLRLVVTAAVAVAAVDPLVTAWRARRRVDAIGRDLARAEGRTIAAVLADALGDPTVAIVYAAPGTSQGQQALEASKPDVGTTVLVRDGVPVATITQMGPTEGTRDVARFLTPGILVAIDAERLQTALRAQVVEVHARREAIVRRTTQVRRRIERDLHDGAQQHLLAVAFSLRAAQARAEQDGDSVAVAAYAAAVADARGLLETLRQISHGVYQPLLDRDGVAAAVDALADVAAVPLDATVADGRPPGPIEAAIYDAVARNVAAAAGPVSLETAWGDGGYHLRMSVESLAADDRARITDRLEAVGGSVRAAGSFMLCTFRCAPSSPRT